MKKDLLFDYHAGYSLIYYYKKVVYTKIHILRNVY